MHQYKEYQMIYTVKDRALHLLRGTDSKGTVIGYLGRRALTGVSHHLAKTVMLALTKAKHNMK